MKLDGNILKAVMINAKCILTLFILTLLLTSTYGQTKIKKVSFPLELCMSENFYKSNKATTSCETYFLITKNTPSTMPPKSKFFGVIGAGVSSDFTIKFTTGFNYYYSLLETQLKFNVCPLEKTPNYYIEPQVGVGLLKHNAIILIGYNMLLNRTYDGKDISGLTISYKYRMKFSKKWYE